MKILQKYEMNNEQCRILYHGHDFNKNLKINRTYYAFRCTSGNYLGTEGEAKLIWSECAAQGKRQTHVKLNSINMQILYIIEGQIPLKLHLEQISTTSGHCFTI